MTNSEEINNKSSRQSIKPKKTKKKIVSANKENDKVFESRFSFGMKYNE